MRTRSLSWVVLLLGCATGPRPAQPDDMSAAAHRREADRERIAARDHMSSYDAHALTVVPMNRADYGHTVPNVIYPLGYYNPTLGQIDEASRHLAHAKQHEQAAAALERYEDQQCGAFPAEVRAACPLLAGVIGVSDVSGGVRIRFSDWVPLDALFGHVRCHLAYSRTRGFPVDDCPLYVRGVTVEVRFAEHALDLLGGDPALTQRIRFLTREQVAPE